MIASDRPVLVRADGLTLREWEGRDVPRMVAMFDTTEMDRWTPLAHPFDPDVATSYVERAHNGRARGSLQLAITEDGDVPLGEVLLFPTDDPNVCECAYAVGAEHRGRFLAARALTAVLPLAKGEGYRRARLRIALDNEASQRVADAAGFLRSNEPPLRRERKGYVLDMATWDRAIF